MTNAGRLVNSSPSTPTRHRARRMMVTTGLAAGVALLAALPASAVPYRVVNTGGIGVWLRDAPSMSAGRVYGPGEGATVDILCQQMGAVGNFNNRTWDKISFNGKTGWGTADRLSFIEKWILERLLARAPEPSGWFE